MLIAKMNLFTTDVRNLHIPKLHQDVPCWHLCQSINPHLQARREIMRAPTQWCLSKHESPGDRRERSRIFAIFPYKYIKATAQERGRA